MSYVPYKRSDDTYRMRASSAAFPVSDISVFWTILSRKHGFRGSTYNRSLSSALTTRATSIIMMRQ